MLRKIADFMEKKRFPPKKEKCCAKVNLDAYFLIRFEIFSHFCHAKSGFKKKFSNKVSKLSLNLCFTANLHHSQDHFSNFLLNFRSLAKNEKKKKREREIWRQKGDLHFKICNCIKCLALWIWCSYTTEKHSLNKYFCQFATVNKYVMHPSVN